MASTDVDAQGMILVPVPCACAQTDHSGIEVIEQESWSNRIHASRETERRLFVPWLRIQGRYRRLSMPLLARRSPELQLAYCVSTNLGNSDESTSSLRAKLHFDS
jgi:hypothetical protein